MKLYPNSAMTEDKDLNILKNFIKPVKYCSKFHEAVAVFLFVNHLPPEEENSLKTVFRYLDKVMRLMRMEALLSSIRNF